MMDSAIWNEDCAKGLDRIPDGSVDLVMMDPPYLLNTEGGGKFGTKNREYHGQLAPISEGIDMILFERIMAKCRAVNAYVWCNKAQMLDYVNWFLAHGCTWDLITWHKTNPTPLCSNKYLSDTEYVIYGRAKGVKLYGTYDTKRKWYVSGLNTADKKKWNHPTIKPLDIVQTLIENSTLPGDVVLDPFMGSGTTAVACKRSGRAYLGFEVSADHYATCMARIGAEGATGTLETWGRFRCRPTLTCSWGSHGCASTPALST